MKKIIYKNMMSTKLRLYILLLLFIISILNGINLSINYINDKITNDILNKIENRSIYVTSIDYIDKLTKIKDIEHVEAAYYNLPMIEVSYKEITNYVKIFNPFLQDYSNIGTLNENEVIVSEKFCENNQVKIGDNIVLNYSNQYFTFEIKGTYNNANNIENYIYISNNNELLDNISDKSEYFVLIDNSYNYNEVLSNLKSNDCQLKYKDTKYENELLTYRDMLSSLRLFFIITYFILISCFLGMLILNIIEKKYNIALLKTFGFSNYNILKTILFEHLFLIIVIYIFNILILKILSYFLSIFEICNFFDIKIIIKNCLIMIILLGSISLFLLLKIKRISLIKLLKNL